MGFWSRYRLLESLIAFACPAIVCWFSFLPFFIVVNRHMPPSVHSLISGHSLPNLLSVRLASIPAHQSIASSSSLHPRFHPRSSSQSHPRRFCSSPNLLRRSNRTALILITLSGLLSSSHHLQQLLLLPLLQILSCLRIVFHLKKFGIGA